MRLCTAAFPTIFLAACSESATPATTQPREPVALEPTTVSPTTGQPPTSDEPPASWRPWRPCGCLEGCAFIEEGRAAFHEGMAVTVIHSNVRPSKRPLTSGTVVLVERSETTDGAGMFTLDIAGPLGPDGTPGAVACSYLCETTFSGPLSPDTCATGTL